LDPLETLDPVLVGADLECSRTIEAYPFKLLEHVSEIDDTVTDWDVSI
jgi:hypothetical protein